MQVGLFGMSVITGGKLAREYSHDGRAFVIGTPGCEYTIRLVNRSHQRVKAVVSVDGLSVMDGQTAALRGPGYVLEPLASLDVPGWRVSDGEVARFFFGKPDQSYAKASTGSVGNVGVLGAAFFEEVPRPRLTRGMDIVDKGIAKGDMLRTTTRGATLQSGGSLGTGFGGRAEHPTQRVEFSARERPAAVLEIRYEEAPILYAMGLDLEEPVAEVHQPEAFPAGFCKPPTGWRG